LLLRMLVATPLQGLRRRVASAVEPGTAVVETVEFEELAKQLEQESFDVVVLRCDDHADGGARLAAEIQALRDGPAVVMLTAEEAPELRASLLQAGCLGVLWEGLDPPAFSQTLSALLARRREHLIKRMDAEKAHVPFRLRDYASASPAMQRFLDTARRVVAVDSTILILGETGVGKEWLARAIHAESPRAGGPFVAINCGALPETLLESELFGHQRGAFTGASRSRRGHFELAHRGILFLDEIGDLPLHLQVKLLRALEERQVLPIGGERPIPVDVRVLAASNRDLGEEVRAQRFRADLYYRLNVVSLTLPPLRERQEDIAELVWSYLRHFANRLRKPVDDIAPEALEAMQRYDWPGNVRELINAMERAVLMSDGAEIELVDLPETIRLHAPAEAEGEPSPMAQRAALSVLVPAWAARPWRSVREDLLRTAERHYLLGILSDSGGRIGQAAERAGLDPRSIFEKMRSHGLSKEDFRRGADARPPRRR
jgi:DNA-binding NtrC family response regulator